MKSVVSNAFDRANIWRQQRKSTGHLLLALDFDGTIAPIAPRVQEAYIVAGARVALERLLNRPDTDVAIISGRGLADLRERCDVAGVYYAGNHGLQIEGPNVHETRAEALALLPNVRAIARRLQSVLQGIDGVYLEDKELSLSVHYRLVEAESEQNRIRSLVEATYAEASKGLRLTYGKRVVEVRPDVGWNKGNATLFVLDVIEKARGSAAFPIFIGDDVTDEDAFVALRGRGEGVIVAPDETVATAATSSVASVQEVVKLIEALA